MSSPSATYDFIKWWATTGQGNYDFENRKLPYLDIHSADMTEEIPGLLFEVFFANSVTYIKMMLVKGVEETITTYEQTGQTSLPAAVPDSMRDILLGKGPGELNQLHTKLTSQLHQTFRQTHSQNEHFWDAMLDPMSIIQMPIQRCRPTTKGEVKMWIVQNAMLWQDHKENIRSAVSQRDRLANSNAV